MNRQGRRKKKYKLYTLHGNDSNVPPRTQSRWVKERKAQRKSFFEEYNNQEENFLGSQPSTSTLRDDLVNSSGEEVNRKMEEWPETTGDDSTRSTTTEFLDEKTDQSDNEVIRSDEENILPEDEIIRKVSPVPLSGYSTEELIPPLLGLALKLRHNLSYAATEDALELAHVLSDVKIIRGSKNDWKNIAHSLCDYLSIHHFCDKCNSYVGKQIGDEQNTVNVGDEQSILSCPQCKQVIDSKMNWQNGNVVLYLNLEDQIKYYLELHHGDLISQSKREKKNKYALEDIFDGAMYKKVVSENTITLNFNVDGTPVFKSSPTSIYPILCTINELPPEKRSKNIILCSLWFGEGKPKDMNEFLKPFTIELQHLNTHGLEYVYQGDKHYKKCQLLVGICDSIARPLVRCCTQFNGKHGCGLCLHPGMEVPKGKGHVRVYPIDGNGDPFGGGLRNHNDTLIHATNREKGIKRRSVMFDVAGFDVINGLVADWMHLATLGVAKQFCYLWLSSNYHTEPFFMGRYENLINSILESFTPTLEISRTTRKISDRTFWKAHEWSIWLLFYSLPILKEIAPPRYANHWALLVDGIAILLRTSIMPSEIQHARRCLYDFVEGVQDLYGLEFVSFNVHLLSHLPDSVLNWGPLWTHSAFMYESFNFILKNCVHSANGVPLQISDSFRYQVAVIKLQNICEESLSHSQRKLLSNLLHRQILPKVVLKMNNIGILGVVQPCASLNRRYYLALKRLHVEVQNVLKIEFVTRILINNEVIHSKEYRRPQKRRSYIILSKEQEIFEIEQFIIMSNLHSQDCYAIGHYYKKIKSPFSGTYRLTHLTFVQNQYDDLAAINVQDIQEKVTLLKLQNQNISIACIHPNKYKSWK